VDFLKIDGDFVRSPRSRADDLVVESIVHMARGLGKQTIAEFVEDEGTLEALRAQGVDYAQGFHIGRPVSVEEKLGWTGQAASAVSSERSPSPPCPFWLPLGLIRT
jgi:EAL domain-containing protein (putative c-di-GMP-specific phosphodiesterase class I)